MSRWHVVTGDCPPTFTGGVATWVEAVAHGLAARGEEVVLYARGGRRDTRPAEGRWDAEQPFPVRRLVGLRWNQRQSGIAGRAVRRGLAPGDRVLATTWPVAHGLVKPCRDLGIPLVVVAHGSEVTRELHGHRRTVQDIAAWARFGAVSGFLAGCLAEIGVAAAVLPAPVDPQPAGDEPREGLLMVSRHTLLKGTERVLRLGDALGWPVTVVGEGYPTPPLRNLAAHLAVPVHFVGRRSPPEVRAHMRRARLLVQLSRAAADGSGAEGLGLVVLEAMACGTPAAVSPVGGLPEAVGPGLMLPEPDEALISAARVRGWLAGGDRGAEQRAWLAAHHGVDRCVQAVVGLADG
ncbi:MAG: glycosyltransferase family 4 protein [Pseudomonadota bacterium]